MKPGRKSAWETKIQPRLVEIAAWCRDGHTEAQMCDALSISVPTFTKYKRLKTSLVSALKINKQIADLTIENSLYKRGLGYEYEETVKEVKTDSDGKVLSKHIKKTTKSVIPDVTAQIFWLKNRKPKEWRDVQKIDQTVKQTIVVRRSARENDDG